MLLNDFHNEAMLERLEKAKQKTKVSAPKWPDRCLIGKDGTPVPFHRAQELLWDSPRRILAFSAGNQVGKTTFSPWWLNREIRTKGAGDYLAITSSFSLFRLKFLPALLQVFEHILGFGRFWAGDQVIELSDPITGKFWAVKATDPMWGRIILRSAQALGGLESATAKAAVLDEAGQDDFTIDAYRAIRRRLTLNLGRMLLTTTLYNLGWINTEIITPAIKDGETKTLTMDNGSEIDVTDSEKADTTLVQADSIVNPEFPMSEYEEAKEKLPSDVFAMFFRGRVTRPRHMIYDIYDDEKHLCPPFKIPDEWPRWMGLDFGGVNTHALYVAQDPGNKRLYFYREYHAGKKSAAEHVADMMFGEAGVPTCYGGAKAEGQWRQEFRTAGLPVREPKVADVWLGINRAYALLKEGLPDQARVQIFDNLDNLRTELTSYHRKTDSQGNPVEDEIAAKNTMHGCDCFRYVCASLPVEHRTMIAIV
jgi:hypothetical protein